MCFGFDLGILQNMFENKGLRNVSLNQYKNIILMTLKEVNV